MNAHSGGYIPPASVLTLILITASGMALWRHRRGWRQHGWKRVLVTSIVLQVFGFFLCTPRASSFIGHYLFPITRIAHLQNFFGHICFIAALSALTYASAYRLVPNEQVDILMRRVDRPAAWGATIMLVSITISKSTRARGFHDFFDVPPDIYLKIYWTAYTLLILYQMIYLSRLLLVLRQDPRSRVSANIYLSAIVLGIFVTFVAYFNATFVAVDKTLDKLTWAGVAVPSILASIAAAYQFYARAAGETPAHRRRRADDAPPP